MPLDGKASQAVVVVVVVVAGGGGCPHLTCIGLCVFGSVANHALVCVGLGSPQNADKDRGIEARMHTHSRTGIRGAREAFGQQAYSSSQTYTHIGIVLSAV